MSNMIISVIISVMDGTLVIQVDGLVWLGYLMHILEDISASRTQIYLLIAALKRVAKMVLLDTINPILENISFSP